MPPIVTEGGVKDLPILPPFVSYENLNANSSERTVVWEDMGGNDVGQMVDLSMIWPEFISRDILVGEKESGVLWETSDDGRKWSPADLRTEAKYIRPKTSGAGASPKVSLTLRMRKL